MNYQVYVLPLPAGNHGLCHVEFSYTQSYSHALLTFLANNMNEHFL